MHKLYSKRGILSRKYTDDLYCFGNKDYDVYKADIRALLIRFAAFVMILSGFEWQDLNFFIRRLIGRGT